MSSRNFTHHPASLIPDPKPPQGVSLVWIAGTLARKAISLWKP